MSTKQKKIFEQPTQDTAINAVKTTAYVAGGIIISRVLKAVVPVKYQTYAQLAVGAIGISVASAATMPELQLAGAGVAALQGVDAASKLASDNLTLDQDTKVNQILKAAFGLNGSKGLGNVRIAPTRSTWPSSASKQSNEPVQEITYEEVATNNPVFSN